MNRHTPSFLPASIERLVEGSADDFQRRLAEMIASLSPDTLIEMEERAYAYIDQRYPDDPGSLLNSRYRSGQQAKRQMRELFDRAHTRLTEADVQHVETVRDMTLGHYRAMLENGLYAQRRTDLLQRRHDQLHDEVQASLAHDQELQRQLALDTHQHQRHIEAARLQQSLEIGRQQAMAEIERARLLLDQPHQLQHKLFDVLNSLMHYYMSLNDRAMRNPAIADRLQMMAMGITAVMSAVQTMIDELNRLGSHTPLPEQLRAQSDHILTLALEQMQQWQDDTRREQDF